MGREQRLPRRPSPTGRARSAPRRCSSPPGCLAFIHSRATQRVSALASTRSLWTLKTSPCASSERRQRAERERRRARAGGRRARPPPRPPAGTGSGRSAASSARRSAPARPGRGTAAAAPARAGSPAGAAARQRDRAAEREQRRQPAEAPGERPQVVAPARRVREAELAALLARGLGLLLERLAERLVVEQRVRVGGDEARAQQPEREREVAHAGVHDRRGERRRDQRHEHDPGLVLGRDRDAQRHPGEHVLARAAGAVDAGDPDQRGASGASVGTSLSAKCAVVHRQERDRQQRARERADALVVEQPRAGDRQQRHGERAQERPRRRARARTPSSDRPRRRRRSSPGPSPSARVKSACRTYVYAGGLMK